jgi:hypothetical protein
VPTLDEILDDKNNYPDNQQIRLADGAEVTLGQLRSGFMKDADYRKKTSELARQREEFSREATAKQSALMDAEARLQKLAERVITANPGTTHDEALDAISTDPVAQRLYGEIQELKKYMPTMATAIIEMDKRLKDSNTEYIAEQHRRVAYKLKEQDPDLNIEELVGYAKSRYIPRLDDAYNLMTREKQMEKVRQTALEEGMKKGEAKAKQEFQSPLIPLRRTITPSSEPPKSLDQAVELASKDMDVVGPLLGINRL